MIIEFFISEFYPKEITDLDYIKFTGKGKYICNTTYGVIHCRGKKNTINFMIKYGKYIKEYDISNFDTFYGRTYYNRIGEMLLYVIKNLSFTEFLMYTSFYKSIIIEQLHKDKYSQLILWIINCKDFKVYEYFIEKIFTNLLLDPNRYDPNIYQKEFMLILMLDNVKDKHLDKLQYLEKYLMENIQDKFIQFFLDISYFNFITFEIIMVHNIKYDNFDSSRLMYVLFRYYFANRIIFYTSSLICAIGSNKLKFAELIRTWYEKDIKEYKISNDYKSFSITPLYIHNPQIKKRHLVIPYSNKISLDSLNYIHNLVIDDYKIHVIIQCLILNSIVLDDIYSFIYLINVFPYEAMTIFDKSIHKKFIGQLPIFDNFESLEIYKDKLKQLKEDFNQYCQFN